MAPFYGWGSTASRLVPLRGGGCFLPLISQSKNKFKSDKQDCVVNLISFNNFSQ